MILAFPSFSNLFFLYLKYGARRHIRGKIYILFVALTACHCWRTIVSYLISYSDVFIQSPIHSWQKLVLFVSRLCWNWVYLLASIICHTSAITAHCLRRTYEIKDGTHWIMNCGINWCASKNILL